MEKQFKPNEYSEIKVEIKDRIVKFYIYDAVFYDFLAVNWHWHFKKHMSSKKWFTQEMADFITQNIQPC